MKRKIINFVALCLAGALALTGCSKSSSEEKTTSQEKSADGENDTTKETKDKKKGDLTVIKFGSHQGKHPSYKDPITGEYAMQEPHRTASLDALKTVEDELGVEIQFVEYTGDTTEALLQSVLANDPVADIVRIYTNGSDDILGQNILQPLDDYIPVMEELGMKVPPEIYGKHYFLTVSGDHSHPLSPLFYNINYIEQVDALKVDGKTVYPTDLYKEGKWTWSVFKDYLKAIDAHFANSQAPVRPENRIDAFRTDYTDALIQAIHSAGGAIYGDDLEIETEPVKKAVKFIGDLMHSNLLKTELYQEGRSNPSYAAQCIPFENGESVFANIEDWRAVYASQNFSKRGESLGFIPFPREDSLAPDSPDYEQVRTGGETRAILKGIPKDRAELAIRAFDLYERKVKENLEAIDPNKRTIPLSIDTFHEKIGQDMSDIYYESCDKTVVNEQSNMVGVYWEFMELAGDSILGLNGTPAYDVALESRKAKLVDKIKSMEDILASDEVRDNVRPKFTQVEKDKKYVFEKGTDPSSIDWTKEYTVEDNIDGELDASKVVYEVQDDMDFNKAGTYSNGVIGAIDDSSGNTGKVGIDIVIFDKDNKTPPTLTIREGYRTVKVDEDTSKINWSGDFVDKATDKDGIDIKSMVEADLSELNTTEPGEYNVKLTVTDYAGNKADVTIPVIVEEVKAEESN